MSMPSFARATRASTLRSDPHCGASKDGTSNKIPIKPPVSGVPLGSLRSEKKLKRPSTLTRRTRESIAYNADLYYIKPLRASKPCPLAQLPSELRTHIYAYVFGDLKGPVLMNFGRIRHISSSLLHVCRAIRIEAAYVYFPEASFTWIVKNLNFTMVIKWLHSLQTSHRALLSRNQNLVIEITPGLSKSFTYPPKNFLLDDTLENHWRACQPFGNLYSVKGTYPDAHSLYRTQFDDLEPYTSKDTMRLYFIFFCRLAAWSRLRNQSGFTKIKWKYAFDMPTDRSGIGALCESLTYYERGLSRFLPQLKKLWVRNQNARIREPIMELVGAFIEAITNMTVKNSSARFVMHNLLERLKVVTDRLETWNQSAAQGQGS